MDKVSRVTIHSPRFDSDEDIFKLIGAILYVKARKHCIIYGYSISREQIMLVLSEGDWTVTECVHALIIACFNRAETEFDSEPVEVFDRSSDSIRSVLYIDN